MGGSISKEERAARKFLNDRIFARIQEYIDRREVFLFLTLLSLIFRGRSIIKFLNNLILILINTLFSRYMLINSYCMAKSWFAKNPGK